MTKKEFRTSVSTSAKNVLKKYSICYADIKIMHSYQMAYIEGLNRIYFQGDGFKTLMETVTQTAENTGLNEKTCFLWFLESAGTL